MATEEHSGADFQHGKSLAGDFKFVSELGFVFVYAAALLAL